MLRGEFPQIPVIVVTATDDLETAVACMRSGAFDYLTKPVEPSRLWSAVRNALEMGELQREVRRLGRQVTSRELQHPEAFARHHHRNERLKSLFRYVEAVAGSPRPILITGESGTGKELMARAIHEVSVREGAFVAVNAAGLDDTVLSDTLFGHDKGAYTGADQARKGLVEKASGGTLFLDEIADLEPSSQTKLLRLLQEGEYYPLGSDRVQLSRARVVAATNADLEARQKQGVVPQGSLLPPDDALGPPAAAAGAPGGPAPARRALRAGSRRLLRQTRAGGSAEPDSPVESLLVSWERPGAAEPGVRRRGPAGGGHPFLEALPGIPQLRGAFRPPRTENRGIAARRAPGGSPSASLFRRCGRWKPS